MSEKSFPNDHSERFDKKSWRWLKRIFEQLGKRRMMFGTELHKVPKDLRSLVAEYIVAVKLHELGMKCILKQEDTHCECNSLPQHTDLVAYKPFIENPIEVPVQVKSVSRRKHGYEIHIEDSALEAFRGFYIIFIEKKNEDIFLYIKSERMKELIDNYGERRPAKKRPSEKRKYLKIPVNLKGFKQYQQNNEFMKTVLKDPY